MMSPWKTSASVDLGAEWRSICTRIQGFDENEENDHDLYDESKRHSYPSNALQLSLISLVSPETTNKHNAPTEATAMDSHTAWNDTIRSIEHNMETTMKWIEDKQIDFISVRMPEDEAFLIQSTVTSFTATTANEIEVLRNILHQQTNTTKAHGNSTENQRQQHQHAVVQALLERLKHIAVVFGKLQKLRRRKAVQIWQHPLQCQLIAGTDPRFLPSQPRLKLHSSFMQEYQEIEPDFPTITPFPNNFRKRSLQGNPTANLPTEPTSMKRSKPTSPLLTSSTITPAVNASIATATTTTTSTWQDLQHEAVLLQATLVDNDLDVVQQMEQQMVNITTLLTQFSDLVAEQQEEVLEILDSAVTSKQNLEKGHENLAEATERTKASRHYMASAVTTMGIILLFLHWVTP